MVDTQRFAIWHPPGMPDNASAKKPTIIPPPNPVSRISRNIGQILKDYNWKDDTGPSTSAPQSSPTYPIPPSSHYRTSGPPQPNYPSRQLDTQDEDDEDESTEDEESVEDEEPILVAPVKRKSPKNISPTLVPSAPLRTSENRAKPQERLQFPRSMESTKGTENKPVSFPPPSSSFKLSTVFDQVKTASVKQKMPIGVPIPQKEVSQEPKSLKIDRSEPIIPAASKATQAKVNTGWRERTNSIPPVPPKLVSAKAEPLRQARSEPVTQAAPKFSPPKTEHPRPETQSFDMGYLANNSVVTLNAFLVQLQETAFDGFKMTMMEASIRQFHLIAADADIQLTRELISMKTQSTGGMRSKLIEKHRMFLEEQAHTVLDGMQEYHLQLRDQYLKATNQEEVWEEVPVELLATEVHPDPEPVPVKVPQATSEVSEKAPEIWKPTWTDDSEPPTPKMAIDEAFERVQADLEREDRASHAPALPPLVSNKMKSLPNRNARTGAPPVSNLTIAMQGKAEVLQSKPAEKLIAQPAEKPAEITTEKPMETPAEKSVTKPATTTKPTAKPKTAKELRAEKNRKGKSKVADAGQSNDPLESAIDSMVPTGNVQGALEQVASAWK